jgi:vitamin K-dependent gamma-carboxylase
MRGRLELLTRKLFEPIDIAPLVYLRIVFGCVMLWEVWRYFDHGWIDRYYSPSDFHFTYYGFEWVRPWPGNGMRLHFAALGLAAACVAAGLFYRIAAALFFFGFTYVFLLDEAHYLNHFYLICLIGFLLIFVPAHRSCSLDVHLARTRRSDFAPAWSLWLLRVQIAIPYVFGFIAKLNADWLRGEPMRMWLARRAHYPVLGSFVHEEPVVWFFTIGGVLLDLLIVPCLLWKRTRIPALLAAASFHLLNAWIFRIGIFPWLMLASSLVFFPPECSRRVLRLLRLPIDARPARDEAAVMPTGTRVIALLVAGYVAVQVLLPLRHFLYPGNVNWTEEGHRFSWHMKLRNKAGELRFDVRDPESGRHWSVDPADRLPEWQLDMVRTHPDMILQYGHYLAERGRSKGFARVEVRARSLAALNGRRKQPLIDPSVDLAKVRRSLWPSHWILPLTEPLRAAASRHRR